METIKGNSIDQKLILVRNIKYIESIFINHQTIISTQGFFGNSNIRILFSNLLIKDIIFKREGEIIYAKHQLPNVVEVRESTFENISSGRVIVETFSTAVKELKTSILFKDCNFSNINSSGKSFFHSTSLPIVEIRNTIFSNFTFIHQRSRIFTVEDKSTISVYDSIFQKNSALTSSLFKIESESILV